MQCVFAGVVPPFFYIYIYPCLQILSDDNNFVRSDQNKCGRGGLEGLPVRLQGGGCLLAVVAAGGVRKWQASRLVRMTNGQTGVTTGQSADPLVPFVFEWRNLSGRGISKGSFYPPEGGKHEILDCSGGLFNLFFFYTVTRQLKCYFHASDFTPIIFFFSTV